MVDYSVVQIIKLKEVLLWSRNEVHKPQQWLDKGKKAVREEPCVAGPDSWINFRGSWGNIKKMVR